MRLKSFAPPSTNCTILLAIPRAATASMVALHEVVFEDLAVAVAASFFLGSRLQRRQDECGGRRCGRGALELAEGSYNQATGRVQYHFIYFPLAKFAI